LSFCFKTKSQKSGKTHTENGVVQGAVMSVILFLVALADIVKHVQEPVKFVVYADNWAIYTSDQDMETAKQTFNLR
jgi:hypothetical protein